MDWIDTKGYYFTLTSFLLPCFYYLCRDWDNLNCLRPHIVTRVTEHVDSHIVPFIEDLVKRGMAYELKEDEDNGGAENGVYFDVRAFQEKMGHMVSCDVLLHLFYPLWVYSESMLVTGGIVYIVVHSTALLAFH